MKYIFIKIITVILVAFILNIIIPENNLFAEVKNKNSGIHLNKPTEFDKRSHNKNRIYMPITNYSEFGQSDAGEAGTFWPYPATLDAYIFGAGIWVGAKDSIGVDNEGNTVYKQLVTVGYNPNDGSSEFAPGALPNSDNPVSETGPLDRVLLSTDEMDRLEWPLEDSEGNKIIRSDQDGHAVFNDLDVGRHVAEEGYPVEKRRLGIEIWQLSYCWSIPAYRDIIFVTYDIINKTKELSDENGNQLYPNGKLLTDVYLGVVCDPDIGQADDDQISYFKGQYIAPGEIEPLELNLGINYDDDGIEGTFTNPLGPGFVGYNFMESPRATKDTYIDPFNTILVPEGEELGMTAFKQFILDTDPKDDDERYLTMRGFNPKTNEYARFDSSDAAEDMRFVQCTGPFDLLPDSSVRVVVAVLTAQTREELKIAAYNAQKAYNLNFILPSPPPSPNLTLVPADKQVTVVWDNYSETVPDPFYEYRGADSLYKEYDFEGYKVYRSVDGATWDLVDSCDVINGFGSDRGLHYSYVDSDELINGYPYYYAVTAYDYNSSPQSLESGLTLNATQVTPRVESSDFIDPNEVLVEQLNQTQDYVLQITSNTLFPFDVRVKDYTLEIIKTSYSLDSNSTRHPFYEYILFDNSNPTDTINGQIAGNFDQTNQIYQISNQKSKIINGVELEFSGVTDLSTFNVDSIVFGDSTLSLPNYIGTNNTDYAFNGNKYQIEWIEDTNGKTVRVMDIDNDIELEYDPEYGINWGFIFLSTSRDLVEYLPSIGQQSLYFAGIKIDGVSNAQDGDIWTVYCSGNRSPAKGDKYSLSFNKPVSFKSSIDMNKIHVVPDPYIVRNEWEGGYEYQKISFVNLPHKCTIRIFTLSGELIKTIEHNNTSVGSNVVNNLGGAEYWDLLTESERKIASGVYIYHIDSEVGEKIGRFAIIK